MQERKKRDRRTNYDRDIHIRIEEKYLKAIEELAEQRKITRTRMTRLIVEEYFNSVIPEMIKK